MKYLSQYCLRKCIVLIILVSFLYPSKIFPSEQSNNHVIKLCSDNKILIAADDSVPPTDFDPMTKGFTYEETGLDGSPSGNTPIANDAVPPGQGNYASPENTIDSRKYFGTQAEPEVPSSTTSRSSAPADVDPSPGTADFPEQTRSQVPGRSTGKTPPPQSRAPSQIKTRAPGQISAPGQTRTQIPTKTGKPIPGQSRSPSQVDSSRVTRPGGSQPSQSRLNQPVGARQGIANQPYFQPTKFLDIKQGIKNAVKIEQSKEKTLIAYNAFLARMANEAYSCKLKSKSAAEYTKCMDALMGSLTTKAGLASNVVLPAVTILVPLGLKAGGYTAAAGAVATVGAAAGVVITIVGGVYAWYEVGDETWQLLKAWELELKADRLTDNVMDQMLDEGDAGISKLNQIIDRISSEINKLESKLREIILLQLKIQNFVSDGQTENTNSEKLLKEIKNNLADLQNNVQQCQTTSSKKIRKELIEKVQIILTKIENLNDQIIRYFDIYKPKLSTAETITKDILPQKLDCADKNNPFFFYPKRPAFDCYKAFLYGRINALTSSISRLPERAKELRKEHGAFITEEERKKAEKWDNTYSLAKNKIDILKENLNRINSVQFESEEWVYEQVSNIRDQTTELLIKTEKSMSMLDQAKELAKLCKTKLGIEIIKGAEPTEILKDEQVVYSYHVKNTGDDDLVNIFVFDDKCSQISKAHVDDRLNPGETWQYECITTLTSTTKNTAQATATSIDGTSTKSNLASVTVKVSDDMVNVPYLLGLSESAAIYDLEELNLIPDATHEYGPLPEGEVFKQDPKPDKAVPRKSTVKFSISKGPESKIRTLYLDPPQQTIDVEEKAFIKAILVFEDNSEKDVTREVVWSMNPIDIAEMTGLGQFLGIEEGKTIIKALYRNNKDEEIGVSTLNIEEEWSSEWEDPISNADDLTAKALPPPPDAFTWYVLCSKSSGDVVYGEDTDPTKFELLAGPLQGPRAAKLWIDQNIPSWRCSTTNNQKGDWNVLCNKQNYSIGIGKSNDIARYLIMASGFTSEKDARSWVTQTCPSWMCNEGGGCSEGPRGGGEWAVVCSKKHGGIGLTRHPDSINSWIYADGLMSEKDARLWVEQRCPSWRCNRDGMCVPGALVKRDKPLELPPDFDEMSRPPSRSDSDSKKESSGYELGRAIGETIGSILLETISEQVEEKEPKGQRKPTSKPSSSPKTADCSSLRKQHQQTSDEMVNNAKKLNCEQNNRYSGCAMDVAGPFFPYWPDRIFSDQACLTGYAQCMNGPFSGYVGCLDGCNSAARNKQGDLKTCGRKCWEQIKVQDEKCKQQENSE